MPTLKEAPPALRGTPEEWLVRAGLLSLTSAGWAWLPLGIRMLRKLQDQLRRRLLDAGAQEVSLPILAPVNLWERIRWPLVEAQGGLRLDLAQPERKARYLVSGWQEPLLAELLAGWLASYRNLPLVVFQIGLVAGTEGGVSGSLADAPLRPGVQLYGFYPSADCLHQTYQLFLQQMEDLLEVLELPYWAAQTEPVGAEPAHKLVVLLSESEQPVVKTPSGEPSLSEAAKTVPEAVGGPATSETSEVSLRPVVSRWQPSSLEEVAFCAECGYTAVRSSARIGGRPTKPVPGDSVLGGDSGRVGQTGLPPPIAPAEPVRCVPTPGARTIAEVTAFLGRPAQQFLKTLIYLADCQPVAILIRGDHQASPVKICRAFGIRQLEMADPATIQEVTGAPVGFSGPVGLKQRIPIWADWDVQAAQNVVVGANQADAHLVGVCIGRDFQPDFFADLRMAMPGDPCPQCSATLQMGQGLPVAEGACLPSEASEQLGLRFHDAQEKLQPVLVHRLQVDLARLVWAMAAVHQDQAGLIWPERFAPFDILLLCLAPEDAEVRKASEELYEAWQAAGLEVLLDDRLLRPGVKFFDADLVGVPWRAVLGPKNYQQGQLELKHRRTGHKQMIPLAEAVSGIIEKVRSAKNRSSE